MNPKLHIWKAIVLTVTLLGAVALTACSDSSGSGNNDNSAAGSSPDNPETAEVGTPLEGTVAAGESYYAVFATTNAGDYDISVDGQNLSWTLYDDPDYTALGHGTNQATVADCASASCTATGLEASTDYYLEIQNSGDSDEDFTLTVAEAPAVEAGSTASNPIELSQGGNAYSDALTIPAGATRYYVFTFPGSSPGWFVVGSTSNSSVVTPEADMDLTVFSDDAFTQSQDTANTGDISFEVNYNQNVDTVYIKLVNNSDADVTFYFYSIDDA